MSPQKVIVRRTMAAGAEQLFDAWLDPASLAVWMRPGDVTRAVATVNPVVGGAFEILMHHGGGAIRHTGVYKSIERPKRLVFTWISPGTQHTETLVTVDFRPTEPGTTEIVLTHEQLPDADAARAHLSGWTRILECLGDTIRGDGRIKTKRGKQGT